MNTLRRWLAPRVLSVGVALAFATWAFVEVAEDVVEGDSAAFDQAVLLTLRGQDDPALRIGPVWLESLARDVTALGSTTVLGLLVTFVAIFLLLAGRRWNALFVPLAAAGGALASATLKMAFARPRPDLVPHGDYVVSASFPSGHAMLSAVVYLTLGTLLARVVHTRAQKVYVMLVAGFLTTAVGLSRIYLGVHWPTDVLAGWMAGAAWALGCWGCAELVKGRTR
ncbi:MAG: phosphatase PAP2 family protein [Gammaproteobacteria bacterium]|nr:phosphatase PAP2 family protein [Gammaproteobacteria bacterium]